MDPELKLKLYSLIHNLKEPYKEVFNLRTLSDLGFKDIVNMIKGYSLIYSR